MPALPALPAALLAAAVAVAAPAAVAEVAPVTGRVVFGSCHDPRLPTRVWPAVRSRLRPASPDAFVWAGDIVYADDVHLGFGYDPERPWKFVHILPASEEGTRELYQQVAQLPGYAELRAANTTVLGIYDDHDFGHNDGDGTFSGRQIGQRCLLDFLGEPADSPRRSREGAYDVRLLDFGGPERQVAVVLLDVRYNREPWSAGSDGDMLGAAQWAWLEETLCKSTARVHLIVSGIQVLPTGRPGENWARFPKSRERLLALLTRCHVRAPLLLSGDVHFAELNALSCEGGGSIVEVTSSGLTHSWWTDNLWRVRVNFGLKLDLLMRWVMLCYQWLAPQPHQLSYYLGLNFGEVEVDWQAGALTTRIFDDAGGERLKRSWTFGELERPHKGQGNAVPRCVPVRKFKKRGVTARWFAFCVVVLSPLIACSCFAGIMLRRCCRGGGHKSKVQ